MSHTLTYHNPGKYVVMQLPNVLLDGTIMVSLKVEMITILSEDLRQSVTVQVLAFSQVYGHYKQVLLKQHLKRTTRMYHLCYLTHKNNNSLKVDLKGLQLFITVHQQVMHHQILMMFMKSNPVFESHSSHFFITQTVFFYK